MLPVGLFPQTTSLQMVQSSEGSELFGSEIEMSKGLVPKVKELFVMGRHAAHLGLKALNSKSIEVGRHESREPLWPQGFLGSIAHTTGLAVAVVAQKNHWRGLGVDVEKLDRSFRFEIDKKMANQQEQAWIRSEPEKIRERTLALFSAKEATFKAFYPLEKVYLNFLDVEFSATTQGFTGTLKKSAGKDWKVGFSFDVLQTGWKGYLVSAVTLK